MKLTQKLDFIQRNHMGTWLKTRQEVKNELSDRCSMFCLCGKLATGLHESYCRKFNDSVTKEAVNRLKHLLTPPKKDEQ